MDNSRSDGAPRQLLLFGVEEATPAEPPELPDLEDEFARLNRLYFDGKLEATVEWSNRLTASAGLCNHTRRHIRISICQYLRRPEMLDATLTHEMVHLIVPDHGPQFRLLGKPLAAKLGVTWREFRYTELWADLSRYKYVYECPSCGGERPSRKRLRASCGRCGPGGYREEFRLVLTESRARPGPVLLSERPVRGRSPNDR